MRMTAGLWCSSLLLVLFPAGCASGPRQATAEALKRHIAYLAGDTLEGRDSGTPGGRKAEQYVLAQLAGAGLDAVETQELEFVAGARLGGKSSLAIGGAQIAPGGFQPYPFSRAGAGEWPAVFVGYGISASDLGRDDYQGLDVKGKAVVALEGAPGGDSPHGKFAAYQGPRAKALKAHELGAAALVLLVDRLPRFEGEDVSHDAGIPAMAGVVGRVAGPLGIDAAVEERAQAEGRPVGRALERKVRLRADVELEKRKARNVLGWLRARGSDAREELIIVGAHHDGLGRGGPSAMRRERLGEIHNGADDNASGAAGVIELARRLSGRSDQLRRSILFITFAGEERGLLGSKWFAQHPLLRIPGASGEGAGELRPVAMANMDMIGRLRNQKLVVSGLATSDGWPAVLAAVEARRNAVHAPGLVVAEDRAEDAFGSSDHLSFYQMKLPVIFFFTGSHPQYHTPDDDLSFINLEGMQDVLGYVEDLLWELGTCPATPAYKPGVDLAPKMKFKVVLRLMPDYGAGVEGMRIAEVTADGPAARGGLKSGDVIVRFGSTPVRSVRDYMVGLEQAQPGKEVEVEYLRDGARLTARLLPAFLQGQ